MAANFAQLKPWLDGRQRGAIASARASWPGPVTWVLKARRQAPDLIARGDRTIAVRVSAHPVCVALCKAFGGPIVSTSANRANEPPARSAAAVSRYFGDGLAGVVVGALGDSSQPSEIRDGRSGQVLRAS